MAKSSKKSPPGQSATGQNSSMIQFIMESLDNIPAARGVEPLGHVPYVDMYSTEKDFIVEAEMPGVRQEDIEITIFKNTLSIKALKYECFDESNINYVCMERSFGKVCRSVDIPCPVNSDGIKAVYKMGILKITLPKIKDKRNRAKKIKIESS